MKAKARSEAATTLHLYHVTSPIGALLTTLRAADNKAAAFKALEWMKANGRKRVHVRRIVA